ncbi:MAG: hypothetical protein JXO51_09755 [Candidatus Aminicenantes bacterium]|nr:hypothetical protein [Candidatus Aminicenantes bacterium]
MGLESVLKAGRDSGYSTVEAFEEKVVLQECDGAEGILALHEVRSDRLLVRAFREAGDPLGFRLSSPDARQVRRGFSELASGSVVDRRKNFAPLLPRSVDPVRLDIYDPEIEAWDGSQASDLRERLRECLVTFPGLSLKGFHLSRALRKVYLANTLGLYSKYRRTIFQAQVRLMDRGCVLEISESRTHFRDIDPQRLVARGASLLNALAAEPEEGIAAGAEILVLAPEAAAQLLKEFSDGLKLQPSASRARGIAASSRVSILDNPLLARQAGSVPFDDEGTAAAEKHLINKGVAVAAVADIRTAFENGGASTGNAFRDERGIFPRVGFSNLYVQPSAQPLARMLQRAEKGVLVHLVKRRDGGRPPGQRLFSAYGHSFAGSEVTRPVHFHFVTSMRSFLLHVLDVSRELRFFPSRGNFGSPYLMLQARREKEDALFV